jgi:hypothetical protein
MRRGRIWAMRVFAARALLSILIYDGLLPRLAKMARA